MQPNRCIYSLIRKEKTRVKILLLWMHSQGMKFVGVKINPLRPINIIASINDDKHRRTWKYS